MRETELKLRLDAEGHAQLKQLLPHHGAARRQVNFFFDSPNFTLKVQRWALRLRLDGTTWFLTAKGPSSKQHGISDRIEIEVPCPENVVEVLQVGGTKLSQIPLEPAKALLEQFGDLELINFLQFENLRQVLDWEGCHLELDHSRCHGQERHELELELPMAELLPKRLALEQWLTRHGIDFKESRDSKLGWALAQQTTHS